MLLRLRYFNHIVHVSEMVDGCRRIGKRPEGKSCPHGNAYGSVREAFIVDGFLASMIASARAWGGSKGLVHCTVS